MNALPNKNVLCFDKDKNSTEPPVCPVGGIIMNHFNEKIENVKLDLDELTMRQNATEAAMAQISLSFPNNDYEGHRRYHQVLIDTLEEKRKLRIAIQQKTLAGLCWAGVMYVATVAWHELVKIFTSITFGWK